MDTFRRDWETELTDLLDDLSAVQEELLAVLEQKRKNMANRELDGLDGLQQREGMLADRLQDCHDRREKLLADASEQGLPHDSMASLARSLATETSGDLAKQVKETSDQMRILRHESLTNWVVAQRSLLHISQMLEIVATGGRLYPTYGLGDSNRSTGGLVDQEA